MADNDVKTLMIQVDASVELLRRNLSAAEGTLNQFGGRAEQMGQRVDRAFARMGQGGAASAGQMRAGMQQLSFQLNDVATQFASGTKPMVIFAQQGSQVLQAVQMMSGESKGLMGVLTGPWGMALTAATVVMTPFVAKLLEGSTAAEENAKALDGVKMASSGLGEAQSVLGKMFDLATGKIKDQNEMLRLNAQWQAVKLRGEAAADRSAAEKTFANVGHPGFFDFGPSRITTPAVRRLMESARTGKISGAAAIHQAESLNFDGSGISRADFINAIMQDASAKAKGVTADHMQSTLDSGKLDKVFLEPRQHRGPSAETLAKRAEAARLKLLDEDSAYTSEERQARHALLDATRKTATSEEQRDALLREDISAEAAATKTKIANDLSAKKINAEQAAHLTDLAEQTRQQKLLNVDLARRSQLIREAATMEAQSYDNQIAILQLQEGFATTIQQRRDIQKQLLALETKRLVAEQQAIIDDPQSSTNQVLDAIGRQQQIRKEQPLKSAGIDRANAMPMEEYAQRLRANTDDMTEALQRVKAEGLGSLEDGLVGAISGTQSLADAFKSMTNQIVADLARIAIEKMIVGVIGGGIFGFSDGGPVLKKAVGGFISGPGTGTSDSIPARLSDGEYVLRAEAVRRIGVPMLDAMNSGHMARFADGGLVAPRMPRLRAAAGRVDAAAQALTVQINAPGATAETVAMIRREILNAAPMIAAAATGQTTRVMNRRRL